LGWRQFSPATVSNTIVEADEQFLILLAAVDIGYEADRIDDKTVYIIKRI
jgi:hypothetical protein